MYKKCFKQYVGETTEILRKRWNHYKKYARGFSRRENCLQQLLFEHFKKAQDTFVS